jgi:hypothetical protein
MFSAHTVEKMADEDWDQPRSGPDLKVIEGALTSRTPRDMHDGSSRHCLHSLIIDQPTN